MFRKTTSLEDRLKRSLVKEGKCLVWSKTRMKNGYGRIQEAGRGSRNLYTHIVAYELAKGAIPADKIVRHTCDNPPCCNPDHLILGTYQDNSDDKLSRGREARGEGTGAAKLTEEDIRDIRVSFAEGESKAYLAACYKVTRQNISRIVKGETWKHV